MTNSFPALRCPKISAWNWIIAARLKTTWVVTIAQSKCRHSFRVPVKFIKKMAHEIRPRAMLRVTGVEVINPYFIASATDSLDTELAWANPRLTHCVKRAAPTVESACIKTSGQLESGQYFFRSTGANTNSPSKES